MYKLAIGGDDPRALEVCPVVALHGPGIAAPVKGAFYEQPGGPEPSIEDEINLQVDGTPAEINALQTRLETRFELARAAGRSVFGSRPRVYLLCQADAAESTYRSLVLGGWVEKVKGERARGSQVLRLHVERENRWEGPEVWATLSNRYGTFGGGDTLATDNRDDSTHDNFVELAAGAVAGDLPARCRIEMCGGGTQIGNIGTVYVGADQSIRPGWEMQHILEAENMPGPGYTTDGETFSGAKYRACQWSGSSDTEILIFGEFNTENFVERLLGKDLRPILRTVGPLALDLLWLRISLSQAGAIVADHPWTLLKAGQELHELPTIRIPPAVLSDAPNIFFGGVSISVRAKIALDGLHTLPVDYIQLTPLEGWRKLVTRAVGCPLYGGVIDDGFSGYVVVQNDGLTQTTDYVGYGEQIRLKPGALQRIYFLQQRNSDKTADCRRGFRIRIAYRPALRRV